MKMVDLMLFMGQSNMAGRGDASLAPVVEEGTGYEYCAVSGPETLKPVKEPFGVFENNPDGVYEPGMKTGSMVSCVYQCVLWGDESTGCGHFLLQGRLMAF